MKKINITAKRMIDSINSSEEYNYRDTIFYGKGKIYCYLEDADRVGIEYNVNDVCDFFANIVPDIKNISKMVRYADAILF